MFWLSSYLNIWMLRNIISRVSPKKRMYNLKQRNKRVKKLIMFLKKKEMYKYGTSTKHTIK